MNIEFKYKRINGPLFSPMFYLLCDEILQNEGDCNVRGNSDIKGEIADPEMSESFSFNCLSHCIKNVFIGHFALSIWFHFL